eukprot:CAMPEP_0177756250 /NCGR_PEP_ID=MMETSP0491_2-20121128/3004_1 /TAXON_ID=63592 /ORGANISM="Tetraselmis chuii, Strain PLY429" /LENGTH=200 /DNA_ID=CAMNT_0019271811 /DNA_START=111 /DNA_END=715 /DNA_ORIENTATION=-
MGSDPAAPAPSVEEGGHVVVASAGVAELARAVDEAEAEEARARPLLALLPFNLIRDFFAAAAPLPPGWAPPVTASTATLGAAGTRNCAFTGARPWDISSSTDTGARISRGASSMLEGIVSLMYLFLSGLRGREDGRVRWCLIKGGAVSEEEKNPAADDDGVQRPFCTFFDPGTVAETFALILNCLTSHAFEPHTQNGISR